MKILLVHNYYEIQGGAEVFVKEVERVLLANGHEVALFHPQDAGTENLEYVNFFPKPVAYKNSSMLSAAKNFRKIIYSKEAKAGIKQVIKKFKPDVVHAFAAYVRLTPSVFDGCREMNVPLVLSCNDYKHICPNYKLYHHGKICEDCKGGKFYNAIKNNCCHSSRSLSFASSLEAYIHSFKNIYIKNVKLFLFSSEFMAKKTEEFWGAESFSWRKLCNPFDTNKYLLEGSVGKYALYFGRVIDEKGINILIDAAKEAPEIPVIIVGDGPDRASLENYVNNLKIDNIQFVGAKWGDELNDLLKNCRFVVVPSLWHENFPYVIFQAFAAGKAVIGSNRGGITELVSHGERGYIYEATSPHALADAMQKLNTSPELEAMGRSAKAYLLKEFSDAKFYSDISKIYKEVIL